MGKFVYALGFFDGVHLGHQALLRACRTLSKDTGSKAGVVTFASHPDTLVLGETPGLITTQVERTRLLTEDYGMDAVVSLPFNKKMQETPWEDFLNMLLTRENAGGFVCGEDFRFGQRGAGNAESLADFCKRRGLPCVVVPDQMLDGVRISSTAIRKLLQAGDMLRVAAFLGRPYELQGEVYRGCMLLPEELEIPLCGQYSAKICGRDMVASLSRNAESGRGFLQIQDFFPELQSVSVALLALLRKSTV